MNKLTARRVVIPLLMLLVLATIVHSEGAETTTPIRPTMRAIFKALTTALPLSLDAQQLQDKTNRRRFHDALQALSDNATKLEKHGQTISPSFDFLQQSLNQNAQEALSLFEDGHIDEARFVLQHLTDNCFLCHSRLPSSRTFPLGQRFLEQVSMTDLSPHERIRLAVAARQFDTALATSEALFRNTDIPAVQIDLMAFFEDYMRIAIRVQGDFARTIKTLKTFQQRSDVPRYLNSHLSSWVETLNALQADVSQKGDELPRARALIQQGQRRNRFLADRQGLAHVLVASSLLHRYVDTGSRPKPQLAEAYYLLGVAESYIPRTSWISETEFYLETAIRLAPTSPFGEKAYAFLEEYVMTGYTGSSGLHLPPEVQTRLDELRRLIDGS